MITPLPRRKMVLSYGKDRLITIVFFMTQKQNRLQQLIHLVALLFLQDFRLDILILTTEYLG